MYRTITASCCLLSLVALLGIQGEASGQQKAQPKAKPVRGAFAKVNDKPDLPRVLLIGDSISIGYTVPVRTLLQGKANVHRAPTN